MVYRSQETYVQQNDLQQQQRQQHHGFSSSSSFKLNQLLVYTNFTKEANPK
jgi:hypothetical protein